MRLLQFRDRDGSRHIAVVEDAARLNVINGCESVYDLCRIAIAAGRSLAAIAGDKVGNQTESYEEIVCEKRLLAPIDHPDPAHLFVTGTGLTHLGSADTRDQMHAGAQEPDKQTDSMKMFRMGLEGGKPPAGKVGVQPEWFYKGTGHSVVAPEADLALPDFASDGGEEAEIVGVYVIGENGTPYRAGFALGNEYSDHVMERENYLWLAPSKIRVCSFGPELLLGDLPDDIHGTSRIIRDDAVFWEKPFVSGEANMSHSVANLEYHQFKYPVFRNPGSVHVHYFGTATLSYADQVKPQDGDVFEIDCPLFGRPLHNTLRQAGHDGFQVRAL